MQMYMNVHASVDDVVRQHGEWSAMAIDLGDSTFTKTDQVDQRLRRLVQAAADAIGKPISECRVLDLACLEGHYAIEFALHGAEAVGIELREANISKAAFAADKLGLSNCTFYIDDVNNLSPESYGMFDIIICSGILYHLTAQDAHDLIGKIKSCCTGLMLLDTYVAAKENQTVTVNGHSYTGIDYVEHEGGTNDQEKLKDLWASVDNETSFWFTQHSLSLIAQRAGFTSFYEVLMPAQPGVSWDRRTYLGLIGAPVTLKSSPATQAAGTSTPIYRQNTNLHPNQLHRDALFRTAKAILPQGVKNAVKPTLRRIGILKTKEAPAFLKN